MSKVDKLLCKVTDDYKTAMITYEAGGMYRAYPPDYKVFEDQSDMYDTRSGNDLKEVIKYYRHLSECHDEDCNQCKETIEGKKYLREMGQCI
jgi:hypothetical protein